MRIFFSHSAKDDRFVDKLNLALQQRGYLTWVDHEDVPAGKIWHQVVDNMLGKTDIMLLVLSSTSVVSDAVMAEWHEFREMDKPIIPIRIEECRPPLLIRHLQRIDFLDENLFEENFERLLKFLPPPQIATNTKEMDDLRAGYMQIKALQHLAGQYNPRVQSRLKLDQMMLVFPDLQQTLVISLNKEKLFVGWHDHHTLHKPDIDLRQFDAIDKGVSRQHALFSVVAKRLQVMDLGSRHGTRVNGIPLPLEQPIDLKNMAIMHFAELEVILFLKV